MRLFKRKPELSEPQQTVLKSATVKPEPQEPVKNIYFDDSELEFMQIHSITPDQLIVGEPIIFSELSDKDKSACISLCLKIPQSRFYNITTDENLGENGRSILFKYAKPEFDRARSERKNKKYSVTPHRTAANSNYQLKSKQHEQILRFKKEQTGIN